MEVDEIIVPDNQKSAAAEFGYTGNDVQKEKQEVVEKTTDKSLDTQSLINDTIKKLDIDENGKFVYPGDMDPMLKAAISATKSFRDTQSSFTKNQQELKGSKAEIEALRDQVTQYEAPTSGLSQEEQTALMELKFTDPDEWHKRMNTLDAQAADRVREKFDGVRKEAESRTVEEMRVDALGVFNEATENKLTQDMLQFDVPPRWVQEVQAGELSFDEFLTRSSDFIFGNKVVKNPKIDNPTNLNASAGGTKEIQTKEGINYADVTF